MNSDLSLKVDGHCHIVDDLGVVHLDKCNAVHPQNISRVIARALANESNFNIHRIAFGNGGTQTDAAYTITYNTPNDGQPPDVRTWDSRIYNETYSETIDEGNVTVNPLLGLDPGSSGPNVGNRPGGGSDPSNDPASIPHVSGPGVRSNELGLTSEIIITAVLNPGEPSGQSLTDSSETNTESFFTFDEIGLYTDGAPAIDSNGYQDVNVGDKTAEDDSGLVAGTTYSFDILIDGAGPATTVSFTTPSGGGSGTGGEILYGDICEAINTGDVGWNAAWGGTSPLPGVGTTIAITNNSLAFTSISGAQTYGFLRFVSGTTGSGSSVSLSAGTVNDMFAALNPPAGGAFETAVGGENSGVQNNPTASTTERERLLTHLIFSPILKSSNRQLTLTYTITVSVARTQA